MALLVTDPLVEEELIADRRARGGSLRRGLGRGIRLVAAREQRTSISRVGIGFRPAP